MRRIGALLYIARRRHSFVTTPIFYANAPPHIGHLYSAVIADAAHRWERVKNGCRGDTPSCSLFTTGTDEHGIKIQKAAQSAGLAPDKFCDNVSSSFRQLLRTFNIQPTDFIRTTEQRHRRVVEHLWGQLQAEGLIKKAKYAGWYSTVDECFYSEQDVEEFTKDGKTTKVSRQTHSSVEWVQEENYMFAISQFYDPIRQWLTQNDVIRPRHYLPLALQCLDIEESLSISRDRKRLQWGIPVPNDPTQTIYVWMDALANYLTVSGYPESHSKCWPPTWQVIGKDILKFHAVFWPAFLMAAHVPLPKRLFVHGHWLVDGVKMSKSIGNVIDPVVASRTLTVDGLRYFLLRQGTPQDDANFTMRKAVSVVNAELVNSLGNLLQRASVDKLNPDGVYPPFDKRVLQEDLAELGLPLVESLTTLRDKYCVQFDDLMIYKALEELNGVVRQANAFFQLNEPWKLPRGNKLSTILHIVYETVRISGILLQPVVPDYSNQLLTRLGIGAEERYLEDAVFGSLSKDRQRTLLVGDPVMMRIKLEKADKPKKADKADKTKKADKANKADKAEKADKLKTKKADKRGDFGG